VTKRKDSKITHFKKHRPEKNSFQKGSRIFWNIMKILSSSLFLKWVIYLIPLMLFNHKFIDVERCFQKERIVPLVKTLEQTIIVF